MAERTLKETKLKESNKPGSTIIAVLDPGQEVKIIKDEVGLFYVELPNGKKGWVGKDVVK